MKTKIKKVKSVKDIDRRMMGVGIFRITFFNPETKERENRFFEATRSQIELMIKDENWMEKKYENEIKSS